MNGDRLCRVALTGGIGAGKSTVDAWLAAKGAAVIDYDAISHALTASGGAAIGPIRAAFGPEAIAPDGSLDRPWAARLVFTGEGSTKRRAALDALIHPLVFEEAARLEGEAGAGVVVHDIPLLVEVRDSIPFAFDYVVVVTAPRAVRVERLVRRGMTREDAERRLDAQTGDAERLAVADAVIDNGAGLSELHAQLDALWARLAA